MCDGCGNDARVDAIHKPIPCETVLVIHVRLRPGSVIDQTDLPSEGDDNRAARGNIHLEAPRVMLCLDRLRRYVKPSSPECYPTSLSYSECIKLSGVVGSLEMVRNHRLFRDVVGV